MDAPDAVLAYPGKRTPRAARAVGWFEYAPDWLFYPPVVLHWAWLGLRHRGLTLMTAANPAIPTGGLCGESKAAILDQISGESRRFIAPYVTLKLDGPTDGLLARAESAIATAGLAYPLVVKPDIGCNGTGVRLAQNATALAASLPLYPAGTDIVLQKLIADPGEAGLFYIRQPGQPAGRLTSATLKYPPMVVGDGRATLRQLILADPRTSARPRLYFRHMESRLDQVPASGEAVQLVFVGNHCKGSTFIDGRDHLTPELTARIDAIAKSMPEFHFGRFDVRYASLAELRQGRGFSIIEVNGAGSEATHIWDPGTSLAEAYRTQFHHYASAFRIGAANRARGARPTPVRELLHHWRNQRRLMRLYPEND